MAREIRWGRSYQAARNKGLREFDSIDVGDRIFVGSSLAEPRALIVELRRRIETGVCPNVNVYTLAGPVGRSLEGIPECHLVLVGAQANSWADYLPSTIGGTARRIRDEELGFDVALVQTSQPDDYGHLSLGVAVDFALDAVKSARSVIAEVNARMPFTSGNTTIHVSEIDGLIEVDTPLPETVGSSPSDDALKVGRHVSEYVPDGATIEVGVGRTLQGIFPALVDHSGLGLHTGLLVDGMMHLMQTGNITNERKNNDAGVSVANQARGSQALYEFVDRNPAMRFMPASYTHDQAVLKGLPEFRAINSAVEVDLFGRVNSEMRSNKRIGGTGGLGDFVRAATSIKNGRSIIALTSTARDGDISRIVPELASAAHVTLTADLADIVVTEYGSATLCGKPLHERAEAIIAIADPRFRAQLSEDFSRVIKQQI
jgi:4-hydroxybutyrate CoA-transferase